MQLQCVDYDVCDCMLMNRVLVTTGRKFWSFPKLRGDNRNDDKSKLPDQVLQISESCSQMVLQFRDQIEVIELLIQPMITCILINFVIISHNRV